MHAQGGRTTISHIHGMANLQLIRYGISLNKIDAAGRKKACQASTLQRCQGIKVSETRNKTKGKSLLHGAYGKGCAVRDAICGNKDNGQGAPALSADRSPCL
jgi:hypothetical protein